MNDDQRPIEGIIYDFDGVIADSEVLSNRVIAETVTGLGLPTTLEESLARYMGKRWPEVVEAIEAGLGKRLPATFGSDLMAASLERFRLSLREVEGASAFIRRYRHVPHCIASSSSAERLAVTVEILGLSDQFDGRVFSADLVPVGKPDPGIFLYAAERIEVSPGGCLVIEDSRSGVLAARAAGMRVMGLCAGAHITPGHAERLLDAGATTVAATWAKAAAYVEPLAIPPLEGQIGEELQHN